MFNFNKLVCISLLVINLYHINVSALLNITEDALDTSNKLFRELEKTNTYSSLKEVNDKLKNISEIFFAFFRRSKETQNNIFVDDISSEFNNAPETLKLTASNFNKLIEEVFHDLSIRYALDEFYEERALSETFTKYPVNELRIKPSFVFMFIENNNRNLFHDKTYTEIINKLHQFPIEMNENNESMLSFITNKTQIQICPSHLRQSHQQLVFNMIKRIATFDAQMYSITLYSLAAYKVFFDGYDFLRKNDKLDLQRTPNLWKDKNVIKRMKQIEFEFTERNKNTLKYFKDSLIHLSRDMWRCDVDEYLTKDEPREGVTFVKMQIFQMYIVNEIDLNERKSCRKGCSYYNQTKIYGCHDQGVCAHQRVCNGTLWDCDNKILSDLQICLANPNSKSRYDYIETQNQKLGKKFIEFNQKTCKNTLVKAQTWHRWFVKCSYCMCTCENSVNDDSYFNLRAVTSNIDANFVVVGVRFQIKNQVTHIQIQQGKLLPNGVIDKLSVLWKEMDDYSIYDPNVVAGNDFHVISWTERTICLDTVELPKDNVVTGLRFKKVDNYLQLGIRKTEFNFTTGKLIAETSQWNFNHARLEDRTEINFDDPISYETTLASDGYLRFTTTSLNMDAGQSTSPFINIQSVHSNPSVPLSGLGMFLRTDKYHGNFLMLKLSTYNVEPHVTL